MSKVITEIEDIDPDATDFALYSGGNDSVCSTHVAYKEYPIDYTVYLDTNTGIDENKEHVKEVCDKYNWDLVIAQSPLTLEEYVLGNGNRNALGFPGPGTHSWAFQAFKQQQLGFIATHINERPRFYSGVRSDESERRMENVEGEVQEARRWTWVSPIHDWTDEDCDDYRENKDLPTNPVAERIGKSGDCFCGAYDERNSTLVELEAHYPGHAEWLEEIEEKAKAELGTDNRGSYWGFGGMSEKELRSEIAKNDESQMKLCSSCDVPDYPKADQ